MTEGRVMANGMGVSGDYYVLRLNGDVKSLHRRYIDALDAALQLWRQFPLSVVKVCDASEDTGVPADGDRGVHSLHLH